MRCTRHVEDRPVGQLNPRISRTDRIRRPSNLRRPQPQTL